MIGTAQHTTEEQDLQATALNACHNATEIEHLGEEFFWFFTYFKSFWGFLVWFGLGFFGFALFSVIASGF